MILADTDVLIDYLAGIQPVKDRIADYAAAEQLQTTAITCFELLSGVTPGRRGDALRRFVNAVTVLPLDRSSAETAAELRRHLEKTGRAIGMADSLIAGIALTHRLPLFTRNRSHFERVDGLILVDPAV